MIKENKRGNSSQTRLPFKKDSTKNPIEKSKSPSKTQKPIKSQLSG